MHLNHYSIRFIRYYKKNGLVITLKRIREKLVQAIFHRDEFVFYSNLISLNKPEVSTPDNFKVAAKTKIEDINLNIMDNLNNHIGAEILSNQLSDRFAQSAIMWTITVDDNLAGYVWSVGKSKIKPYYIALCNNDAFLFDGSVLQQYRGRNIYPVLLANVLFELKKRGYIRAFFDAHEWNISVHKAFSKIQAQKLGTVRKYSLMGRTFVLWKIEK